MEVIGFHSAKNLNQVGKVSVGTNALDKNVNGNNQAKPAVLATWGDETDKPMVEPIQAIEKPKANNNR